MTPKLAKFIKNFPNFKKLATASLKNVLKVWQGMGYNRRALYLHKIATKIIGEFKGKLPANETMLLQFKGIGKNTAASVCAFAFNQPTVFIETNIRTVYIHHFFKNRKVVIF
jgi:A/G-specific adenine glycosylase